MPVRRWQTTGRELFPFTLLTKTEGKKWVRRQLIHSLFKPEVILVAHFAVQIARPGVCTRVVREQE